MKYSVFDIDTNNNWICEELVPHKKIIFGEKKKIYIFAIKILIQYTTKCAKR